MKKRFSLLLTICLCLSLCGCAKPVTGADYPAVFVHGYSGWGSYDDINPYIPYWGMTACDAMAYLRSCGADRSPARGTAPASYMRS